MTVDQLLSVIRDGGVIGLLVVIVVGGARGWYVWRWQHQDVVRDRDYWRRLALRGTGLAELGVRAAEKSDDA